MGRYIRANDSYEDYKLFQAELDNIRREWYANPLQKNTKVNIFDYEDGGFIRAGVNWGAWGTQPPEDTKEFAEALLTAAELCEELNNKFPNIEAY